MARASWADRNERARALGYRNYYDYRVHDYGRRPASEPAAGGEELARLRGHRADADLRARLERGDVELASSGKVVRDPTTGQFRVVDVTLVDSRGRTVRYRLKRLGKADREALAGALAAAGARVAGYLKSLLADTSDASELGESEDEAAA